MKENGASGELGPKILRRESNAILKAQPDFGSASTGLFKLEVKA